jgi:ribulose-5-phosphate 4-epimerase/fuculose-1-phosphate aldolase
VPEARDVVVRTARAMRAADLVVATQGNVSVRDGERIWITPTALPYPTMRADDVVGIDFDGAHDAAGHAPSSEWRVHTAVYAAREDVGAIVHTHSVHATAWSHLTEHLSAGEELPEGVATAPYARPGSDAVAVSAVAALGRGRAVLLARHGVLGVGRTAEEALDVCLLVEHAARVAWLLRGD